MKELIVGYNVDTYLVEECCDAIFASLNTTDKSWLACFNPHSYAESLKDEHFTRALKGANWLIPDGFGVLMASHLLCGGMAERVTGSDVFYGLLKRMNSSGGMNVFFLGSTEETLADIRGRMSRDYPNIEVAGTYSPPFEPRFTRTELDQIITAVNSVKPDVLWVGMTAPKQEKWIYDNLSKLDVKFVGAIGAVFDFYTGKVRRAHPVLQRYGLEWFPRLLQQPRRLWRRMFISAPVFLMHVAYQKIKTLL